MDKIKHIILSEANLRNHTTFHYPNHSKTVKAADFLKCIWGVCLSVFGTYPICVPFLKVKTIGPGVKRQVVIRPRRVSFSKHQFFFVGLWNEDTWWSDRREGDLPGMCSAAPNPRWGGSRCGVGAAVLAFSFVPLATPSPPASSGLWLQGETTKAFDKATRF